jgi:F-type H+-transporting ATPase subunit b
MIRLILALTLMLAPGLAQSEAGAETARESAARVAGESPSEGEHGRLELWKWANFLILAGVLGYMISKNAGPFFTARSRQIRKDMMEAEQLRKEAEVKASDVDRRLANLGAEIESLRQESQREEAEERQRIIHQTNSEIAKIQHHAQQEIESAGKAARMELKRYSAQLAVDLAEQKIRARIDANSQDALVAAFVQDLRQPSSRAQSTSDR